MPLTSLKPSHHFNSHAGRKDMGKLAKATKDAAHQKIKEVGNIVLDLRTTVVTKVSLMNG